MTEDVSNSDRRSGSDRRQESLETRVALLEDQVLRGMAEDLRHIRKAFQDGVHGLDKRVTYLEEVRVRSLEDWRLSRRVLETERTENASRHFARWELWLGVGVVMLAALIGLMGTLIGQHVI